MKALIPLDSPLYLKRLVRELNAQEHGFYASCATFSVRCNRAQFVKGEIRVRSLATSPIWSVPSNYNFSDAYGRDICASRQAI